MTFEIKGENDENYLDFGFMDNSVFGDYINTADIGKLYNRKTKP